ILPDNKILLGGSLSEYQIIIACYLNDEILQCSAAPSGLFATNITTNKVKLHWTADAGAIKYKVQYRASTSPVWISLNATTNLKLITGLAANTTYKYRVRSLCADVPASAWSSIETFTTLPLREGVNGEWSVVNVYPNPNSGEFTIDLPEININENISIEIKNMLCEIIYNEQINTAELNHQVQLNKNIANGIYVVELKTHDKIYSQQIIVSQ
ncbi:MAG: fibronectin type III domain-containing protein, partial [Fimbriimonadaceae bacterium]|nr:fibronectin type III domain-containing protein [Chitinophagales bacterium]